MIDHEVSHVRLELNVRLEEVIVIPGTFSRVFFGQDHTGFAGMANTEEHPDDAAGMLMVVCGASTTIF
jgi:hypothetical protein